MDIGFVYTGEKRFEKIGRENHNLLYNELSEFTSFKIYDECKKDREKAEEAYNYFKYIADTNTVCWIASKLS